MIEGRVCARCGATLKHHARGGLCPQCLLLTGLELETDYEEAAHSLSGRPAALPHALGDYELLEVIASGGMGIVYRARQRSLNRIVAVKTLLAGEFAQPRFLERFRSEAEAVGQLQHPNIVAIHEVGEADGQPFFSMDYVEGKSLAQVSLEFQDRSAEFRRCARWVKIIAETVHYAHQKGVIHRDLKPANVMIDESDQPRITDFGLAKKLTESQLLAPGAHLTVTGQVLGSPNYLPPEQAAGKPAGVGSDVYALGAILYHLLTGRPPFEADSLPTLLRQVVEAEPVSPRSLNPGIPRDLETISLKCLEKESRHRYQTAHQIAEDLARFLEDRPILARPVGAAGKAWKWCLRRPALAATSVALALTFLLGAAGILWGLQRARQNAQAELRQRQRAEAGEYAADMRLAQLSLANNNRGLAVSLLNKYRPAVSTSGSIAAGRPTDLRGWEWRYLWQLCQGDEALTLHTYPREINAMACSEDGTRLAVATMDDVVLWDLNSRKELRHFPVGPRPALAFSPAENLLATGAWDTNGRPAVALWSVETGELWKIITHEAAVRGLAFSPNGGLLASFDNLGTVEVVDWASGVVVTNRVVSQPRYATAGVVAFSPDGNRLAIGEDYGRVRVLDLRSGAMVMPPTELGAGVVSLAFSPESELLAAGYGYGTGTIRLWNSRSGEPRGQLTNHTSDISALAFTPDNLLVSASRDGTIRTWDPTHCAEIGCLEGSGEALSALAVLRGTTNLVTGGRRGSLTAWTVIPHQHRLTHAHFSVSPGFESFADLDAPSFEAGKLDWRVVRRSGVAFTPDSRSFIATGMGGSLILVDTSKLGAPKTLVEFGSNHWGVAMSPDGRYLVTGNDIGTITVWRWPAGSVVTNFDVPFEWLGRLCFSRSGNYLLATIVRNDITLQLRLWDTRDWNEIPLTERQFAGMWALGFTEDERRMAAGFISGEVKLFHFPFREPEVSFGAHRRPVVGVHFLPGDEVLVSTGMDGPARILDVATGRELSVLRGHLGDVDVDAISPEGSRLITGGENSNDALRIWDLIAHREILAFECEGKFFIDIAFSPDRNVLAATAMSGTVHLWRAPSWEEIEVAEKQAAQASAKIQQRRNTP